MSAGGWLIAAGVALFSLVAPVAGQDAAPKAQPAATGAQPEVKPDGKKEYSIETLGGGPGPAHQRLAKLVGEWETASRFTMPGRDAVESKGQSKFTLVLGGRFLSEDDRGTMNGGEFSSVKLWGFNTASQKYESVWTHTGATSMMTMTGASQDAGKTVVYDASYEGASGRREQMTITMKIADDDHFSVTVVAKVPGDDPAPTFETSYSRKK